MLDSPESIKCSICGRIRTAIADPDSGEIVCSNCGMVITEKNQDDVNPERRAFTYEEQNATTRTGAPSPCRHDKGLATIIGKPTKDASGRILDAKMHVQPSRG